MTRAAAVLIPVILAVLVAWPGRRGGWIRDDLTYVVHNPQVVLDRPLAEAFTTPFAPDASEKLGLWRPVTTVSFMLDHRRVGEDPTGFHHTQLLLAGLAAALLFGCLFAWGVSPWTAAAAASVYAVHPARSEAVLWISGRAELLMTVFALAALWVGSRGGTRRAIAAAACVALSVMSKEQGMMLAVLLPLCPGLETRDRLRHVAITGGVVAALLVARWCVLGAFGPEGPMQVLGTLTLEERWFAGCGFLADYVVKLVKPLPLLNEYDDPDLPIPLWKVATGAIALLAVPVAAWTVMRGRDSRAASGLNAFAWLLFVLPLVPVLNIVWRTGETFAERFLAWPTAGAVMLVACQLERRLARPVFAAVLLFGLVLPLGAVSWRRASEWASVRTLFEAQIAQAPLVGGGYQVLGAYLIESGEADANDVAATSRAESLLERAVMLAPERVQAALAYGRLELRRAGAATDPDARSKALADAVRFFTLALRQDPELRTASGGLALAYALQGLDAQAESAWKRELERHPQEFRSALNYANWLRDRSREADARAVVARARAAVVADLSARGEDDLAVGSTARQEALRVLAELEAAAGDEAAAEVALDLAVKESVDPEAKVRAALERARLVERRRGREDALRGLETLRNGLRDAVEKGVPERAAPVWWSAIADVEAALGDVAAAREALEAARLAARGLRLAKIERALAALPQAPR